MRSLSLSKAVFLSMLGKYSHYIAQLVSMVVLARVFTPDDYGKYASVYVFYLFFSVVCEFGIIPALINVEELDRKVLSKIRAMMLLLGVGLFFVLNLCSIPIELYYSQPDVQYDRFLFILSLCLPFVSLTSVNIAILYKLKGFIKIGFIDSVSEVLSLLFVFALKNKFGAVELLCLKLLSMILIRYILSIIVLRSNTFVVECCFDSKRTVFDIFNFAWKQLNVNILSYITRNYDNILVAKFYQNADFGVYDKAYQLMKYPLYLISFSIQPAIQPSMNSMKNSMSEFKAVHDRFFSLLLFCSCFISLIIIFISDFIVFLLLGDSWGDVAPLLKILALSVPCQMAIGASGGFFQSLEKPREMLIASYISVVASIAMITIGALSLSLETLCWCIVLSYYISFSATYYYLYIQAMKAGVGQSLKCFLYFIIVNLLLVACYCWSVF